METRDQYHAIWQKAYDNLNASQKLAVNNIEGPVMAIAGPGTGKTQLLAVRIGKILLETDSAPQNILCLTYTDAGVVAMRNRLLSFIGPEAYNVSIYTFHSFCNSVIKENIGLFTDFRDLEQLSDIEEVDVYRSIIDRFGDDHLLKRYKDPYWEKGRLKSLFNLMKQERWTHQTFVDALEEFKVMCSSAETVPPQFAWGRSDKAANAKKGDPSQTKISTALEKYEKAVAASAHLDDYQAALANRQRYDYQDMILMVIKKFAEVDSLLGKYQERFQYILVDEYQDTNGAQNELLFQLSSFDDSPNLFIVGDDDQSIFRFQGANMSSIVDFKEKYNVKPIVLINNYRSTQQILDSASKLIVNNQDRLVNKYPELVKDLVESRLEKLSNPSRPHLLEYENPTCEEIGIINKIIELHGHGVPYKEMAIIYSKHKYVENIVQYFTQKNIPLNIRRRVDVLKEVEVEKIVMILNFLDIESRKPNVGRDLLFKIMHFDYFNLKALDIAMLSIALKQGREKDIDPDDEKSSKEETYIHWRQAISDPVFLQNAQVRDIEAILAFSRIIEVWLTDLHNFTVQVLLQKILTESRCVDKLFSHPDKTWLLQVVNTFFDFVKDESAKSKAYTLPMLIDSLRIMEEDDIALPIQKVISDKNGINFLTAHGSKGLEFDHVFIIKANATCWEKRTGGNQNYTLPLTLVNTASDTDIEDDRRLFFVAMTRAADQLYITRHKLDDKGKELTMSKFITEFKDADEKLDEILIDVEDIVEYKTELMRFRKGEPSLIDDALVDRILENYKLSVTHLNKYLKCKTRFYFENILRVPLARNAIMGFGSVIHYAFEHFFRDINTSAPRSIPSLKTWNEYLGKGMDKFRSHFTTKEYENYLKYGELIIEEYYTLYQKDWFGQRSFEIEYDVKNVEHRGVPITGQLDRIDIYDDHIQVIDYKTGKSDRSKKLARPTSEKVVGGDFWRQIVFYRFLIDGDKRHTWIMKRGVMDFLEKESGKKTIEQKVIEISREDMSTVSEQIVDAYRGIKNKEFTPGCGEDDCEWCNFVLKHMPVSKFSDDNDDYHEN